MFSCVKKVSGYPYTKRKEISPSVRRQSSGGLLGSLGTAGSKAERTRYSTSISRGGTLVAKSRSTPSFCVREELRARGSIKDQSNFPPFLVVDPRCNCNIRPVLEKKRTAHTGGARVEGNHNRSVYLVVSFKASVCTNPKKSSTKIGSGDLEAKIVRLLFESAFRIFPTIQCLLSGAK